MTPAIRKSFSIGDYVASEALWMAGTQQSWLGGDRPAVICHGYSTATYPAASFYGSSGQRSLVDSVARHCTVGLADLGGNQYGSNTGITRIGQVRTHLASEWGTTGTLILIGVSAGVPNALAYALANPTLVGAVVGILPILDLAHARSLGAPYDAAIDAAYGGTYNDLTDGPTHSPVQFAASLPSDMPIHLFTSSDDTLAVPSTANAFMAARPQTTRTDLGAVGHSDSSVAAAVSGVVEWLTDGGHI